MGNSLAISISSNCVKPCSCRGTGDGVIELEVVSTCTLGLICLETCSMLFFSFFYFEGVIHWNLSFRRIHCAVSLHALMSLNWTLG